MEHRGEQYLFPADKEQDTADIRSKKAWVRNDSFERLLCVFRPMITSRAWKYRGRIGAHEVEDLVQVGCMILYEAIGRWDPSSSARPRAFHSYFYQRLAIRMLNYFGRHSLSYKAWRNSQGKRPMCKPEDVQAIMDIDWPASDRRQVDSVRTERFNFTGPRLDISRLLSEVSEDERLLLNILLTKASWRSAARLFYASGGTHYEGVIDSLKRNTQLRLLWAGVLER